MTRINRVGHAVLYASDPAASAAWYRDVLDMEEVTRIDDPPAVFLSFGRHDHDIALFRAPPGRALGGHDLQHLALELEGGLDDLKRFHATLVEKDVRIDAVVDHGISFGIYFFDPDGHRLEVYFQRVPQDGTSKDTMREIGAIAEPIDLEMISK